MKIKNSSPDANIKDENTPASLLDLKEFDAKRFLEQQHNTPGVYQMFDAAGKILYVGKAKSLKKRLSSYFQHKNTSDKQGSKTRSLVKKISRIEVTVTATETEALLLEQSLIKEQLPPYNILLRDDKSYPYIFISTEDAYPRIDLHRGPKRMKGRYFGPFPSSGSVRESLQFLQKTFRVRQCDDNFFKNRSRPCLQYQIQRCTAPCVNNISVEDYAEDVRHTSMFLEGKEDKVMQELANNMEKASADLAYEDAAKFRDQISHLRHIQEQQSMEEGSSNVDVIAIASESGFACVQVITVRQGRVLGSRSYFPDFKLENDEAEILAAFIPQYYLGYMDREIPREIIINIALAEEQKLLADALSQHADKKIQLLVKVRGHRNKWQELATRTAQQNVLSRVATRQNIQQRFQRLQDVLKLETVPERIECFDISHSSGEATVASCVVFDQTGPVKSDYRRFNIEGVGESISTGDVFINPGDASISPGDDYINPGDDYAAMKQALERRYTRVQKESGRLPDLLLIDGGKGQLSQAHDVLRELQITSVTVVGVAKGSTRKAGFETLIIRDADHDEIKYQEVVLASHDPALHLIQQIRDEAHRFAITGHKQRRDKKRITSRLENIPGVGAKRRRELLRFFGGQQEIARAGVDELARVSGISEGLAQAIYDAFHEQ